MVSAPVPPRSPQHLVLGVPDLGHSNRCVVVSPCFNLHDSSGIECGASFHMLIAICLFSLVRFYFLKNILENFVNLGLKTLK